MSNKRGSRGRSKSNVVVLKIRNEAQLQRTLDLCGIIGDKPSINEVMERISARLDEEHRRELLAVARRWTGGWSDSMIYDCMGEDYPGFDDEEVLYERYKGSKSARKLKELNKKLFKRMNKGERKAGKKKYNRGSEDDMDDFWNHRATMYTHGELDSLDNEDEYEDGYKCIKFYDDIENELCCREFDSLKAFDDFCRVKGYKVGPVDYNNLVNGTVVHCCLDPISKEYGENEVITDNSYGALYWTVSDDITKKVEQSFSGAESRTFTD